MNTWGHGSFRVVGAGPLRPDPRHERIIGLGTPLRLIRNSPAAAGPAVVVAACAMCLSNDELDAFASLSDRVPGMLNGC